MFAQARHGRILTLALLAILVALTVRQLIFGTSPPDVIEFVGNTMGTTYSVKVANTKLTQTERSEIADLIARRLEEVNALMSTYDSTSELEQLNRAEPYRSFAASSTLIRVLAMARSVSKQTGGAFDVTVRPYVDAWGFGPGGLPGGAPSIADLKRLANGVGYELLTIDTTANTVTKRGNGVVLDLSAIAKGFGVDHVVESLKEIGLCCFLVEVGGEVRAQGTRTDGHRWRIGLERPDGGSSVLRVLELGDEAVATSGDYRNFLEWNGVRYAHIVDPRTGFPIPFTGSSVTVRHEHAALADAWATALVVLGTTEGVPIAERYEIAAHFAWLTDTGFATTTTSAFEAPERETSRQ